MVARLRSFQLSPRAGGLRVVAGPAAAAAAAELLEAWAASWPPGVPLAGKHTDAAGAPLAKQPRQRELVLVEASEASDREWLGSEGYQVVVTESELRIVAASADGFHRGAATLRQALGVSHSEGREVIPTLSIKDRPQFSHRGLMLDAARHFFPVAFIKQLMDWMYLYKLNVFHWHLTDDEGWRLEVKALPNLTAAGAWRGSGEVVPPQYGGHPQRYGGFYSHEDVREVVRYGEARGIAIIPEVDVPGHCFAAVRALPELLGKAVRRPGDAGPRSVQGFQSNVLDPAAEETYTFLEAVFAEVLELFPAPLGVHIGMDEIPAGAWSDNRSEEDQLKARLAGWLQDFLAKRGKALVGWEEAFYGSGLSPNTQPRAVAFAWKEDERFAVGAATDGFDVVLCPAHFLYLDLVQGGDFEERGLYWATPQLPVERVYSYAPMDRLARLGLAPDGKKRIRGVQANLWSETVDSEERAKEMLFPRLLAAAEVAWSAQEGRSWTEFRWRLAPQLNWLARDEGVHHGGGACGLAAQGDFLKLPRRPDIPT